MPEPLVRKKSGPNKTGYSKIWGEHEMVISLTDSAVGLNAYIAIHSTKLGPALGGTRLLKYSSDEDALEDTLKLSKAMSYKCALAGLPYGGGKGVIMLNENCDIKEILKAYAERVDNLRGLFKTGTDVGLTEDNIAYMGQFTKHMLGLTPGDRGDLSTGTCAAMGVYSAIKATMKYLDGSTSLKHKKISIKGVGKLGGVLAELIDNDGGLVYIADIDKSKCEKLSHLKNVHIVSVEEIHKLDVDVYSPNSLGGEFNKKSIEELKCRAIVGGANNQLSDHSSHQQIEDEGIVYIPDYIANAGGLIYVADELEAGGFKSERVRSRIDNIQNTVYEVLMRSQKEHKTTDFIANSMAEEIIGFNGS